jgi:nitrate reductase assembly molybdenum cofactor insertion protein NarJ
MQADKSAIILEAQWMEQEIPRIQQELDALQKLEQELLTTPIEMVNEAYTATYQAERRRAHPFYHRHRSVTPTQYGYKERMLDVGWFTVLARLIILAAIIWAGYIVYDFDRQGDRVTGIIWGLVVLVVAIGIAFVPAFGDEIWERVARKKAEAAVRETKASAAFQQEKQKRQNKLQQCRTRITELQERLSFSRLRYEELRRALTRDNYQGTTTSPQTEINPVA